MRCPLTILIIDKCDAKIKERFLIMGLRNRIANYSEKSAAKQSKTPNKKMKKTSILDVTFCGYRCENEEGMILYIQKPDEELTKKIMNNSLTTAERNWILGLGCDYYCKVLPNDDHLVEFTIARPIIDYFEKGDDSIIDESILNMDNVQAIAFQKMKNKETGEKEFKFNKNKLRKADNASIISCVTDPSFVYDNWMDAAYNKNSDIKNFITIDGLDSELEHTLTEEPADVVEGSLDKKKPCGGCSYTKTRKFRRRSLIRN